MMDRIALGLPLAILLALALLSFVIEQSVKEARPSSGISENEPDSIVENFMAVSTDIAGIPRYRLAAERLSHFSGSQLTLLGKPKFSYLHPKQGEMQISSDTATVSPQGEKVIFSGQVHLLRPAFQGGGELSMQTSTLDVLTQQNEAYTEAPVLIQQPGMQVTANGLHLFANTRVLKLKGRVKVQYQNASRA